MAKTQRAADDETPERITPEDQARPAEEEPELAKKQKRFLAQLTGGVPFAAVDIPGADPSKVITREPTVITQAERDLLLSGLKEGKIPGVKADNFVIEEEK